MTIGDLRGLRLVGAGLDPSGDAWVEYEEVGQGGPVLLKIRFPVDPSRGEPVLEAGHPGYQREISTLSRREIPERASSDLIKWLREQAASARASGRSELLQVLEAHLSNIGLVQQ